jgi:hypothetical protein
MKKSLSSPTYETNVAQRKKLEEGRKELEELQRLIDLLEVARGSIYVAAMESFRKGYITNDFCDLHKACDNAAYVEDQMTKLVKGGKR